MLTVPSMRYIKKLTSTLLVESGLTENTIKYMPEMLDARDLTIE